MKLGIAFAGGGVRGAAHLGILQALEEQGIEADCYTGTSAGSVVAAMKALGYDNATCMKMMEGVSNDFIDIAYWDIIKNVPNKFKKLDGLLKGDNLKTWLKEYIGEATLLNVKHGLGIISTDINTGTQIVFTSEIIEKDKLAKIDDLITSYGRYTPLTLPYIIYASCAVPGIFRPLEYNNMRLVDGSIVNNLPANILKAMNADKILTIDLAKRNPNKDKVEGIFDVLSQSISVLVEQNTFLSLEQVEDVVQLHPDISNISLLDFDKVSECYQAGYEYGKAVMPFIKNYLKR